MATHQSAIKRQRQNIKRRARNRIVDSRLKTLYKKVSACTKKEEAAKILSEAISHFHKAAQKGILHKNTANRRVSGLQKFVNQLS